MKPFPYTSPKRLKPFQPFCLLLFFLLVSTCLRAQGVAIVGAGTGTYLTAINTSVAVDIRNQVATTVVTTSFLNSTSSGQTFTYGFPMPEGATATGLRWKLGSTWYTAAFEANAQNNTLPGSSGGNGINVDLKNYLGANPLYFEFDDELAYDSTVVMELTYVQLAPYRLGEVTYTYPGDYHQIQSLLLSQQFTLTLASSRTIESVSMPGFTNSQIVVNNHDATVEWAKGAGAATENYVVKYTLNSTELGLFTMSNFFPDSTFLCDDYGKGFFAFIAEPEPNPATDVIDKVFTLIIDRSGSMSGTKMTQAKDAAKFIVEHLNEGDRFNIIDFDDIITPFKPDHVLYTPNTESQALSYIQTLYARGSTNISGAFSTAIAQFQNENTNTYNVILFFTDGQPTAGITSPSLILNSIQQNIANANTSLNIFCFGIGTDVSKPLLTNIANENNGTATFLGNNQVEDVITDFYIQVRNPVILNTQLSFSPSNIISETYPVPVPNLFKGFQTIVTGRYNEPAAIEAQFSGEAFGTPVTYTYPMALSGTDSAQYHFLPKLWAKQKTEYLLQKYYAASNQAVADGYKEQITAISLCYKVITPFTSFTYNPNPTAVYEPPSNLAGQTNQNVTVTALSPNPARSHSEIRFNIKEMDGGETVRIQILDALGVSVQHLFVDVSGPGDYNTIWDLTDFGGKKVPAGTYLVEIQTSKGRGVAMLMVQ